MEDYLNFLHSSDNETNTTEHKLYAIAECASWIDNKHNTISIVKKQIW